MGTFSALLALCAGNSPVTGEFPAQRPVTRSFEVSFDLCLNNLLSKQTGGWRFETPSRSLWRIALASHLCTCVLHRQLCYLHTLKLPKFFNFHGDFHQKWHFAHPEFSFAHPELPFLAKSMLWRHSNASRPTISASICLYINNSLYISLFSP